MNVLEIFKKSDYMNLCSKSINKGQIARSATVFSNAKDCYYVISHDGNSIYKKLNGKDAQLNNNQTIYDIVSADDKAGGFYLGMGNKFEGYAIIEQDAKTNMYYIVEIYIKDKN